MTAAEGVPTGRTGEDSLDAERDHTGGGMPVAARPTNNRPGLDVPLRMWVADSFDGLGADIWIEGDNGSRLGGERTLVWRNVRYDWARALVAAWNDEAVRQGGDDA